MMASAVMVSMTVLKVMTNLTVKVGNYGNKVALGQMLRSSLLKEVESNRIFLLDTVLLDRQSSNCGQMPKFWLTKVVY